jgi:hypothetical protein
LRLIKGVIKELIEGENEKEVTEEEKKPEKVMIAVRKRIKGDKREKKK